MRFLDSPQLAPDGDPGQIAMAASTSEPVRRTEL
jgi:hypothetical protein